MKLTEIFGTETRVMHKTPSIRRPNSALVGAGYFAMVYVADPDNPHEVIKVTYPTNNPDPYVQFVLELANHPDLAEDNLYLPRVYEINHTAEKATEIKLEKLERFLTVTLDDVMVWAHKALTFQNDNDINLEDDIVRNIKKRQSTEEARCQIFIEDILLPTVTKIARNDAESATIEYAVGLADLKVICKDSKMLDALDIWRAIRDKNSHSRWDVTSNNIMWRRTSVGVHPVFTDLLAA